MTLLIYLSYADADQKYGKELEMRLGGPIWRSMYDVSYWSLQSREQGTRWRLEMAEKMDQASLFLALASPDYLSDEKCLSEMVAALRLREEGRLARVFPILLRPCALEDSPLRELQAFPIKKGFLKALATWGNKDDAWYNVEGAIRDVVKAIRAEGKAKELP